MNFGMKSNGSLKTDVISSTSENVNQAKKVKSNKFKFKYNLKNKMTRNFIILLGVLIGFLIILFLFTMLFPSKKTYTGVEEIMEKAAIKYYSEHSNKLPKVEQGYSEVRVETLIKEKYMKDLNSYLDTKDVCTGKVTVSMKNSKYSYISYLDCGDLYKTTELYKKVNDTKNIVTSGYGLYNINNEFVFRGEIVNNYVKVDNVLFRIVKINSNNELVLIANELSTYGEYWDNRYNSVERSSTGINDYRVSRIKEILDRLYAGTYEYDTDAVFGLGNNTKSKMVPFNQCIGKIPDNTTAKDNSNECSEILENQMIGLLTASDFVMASTDGNCINFFDYSCQNYNYLKANKRWWLATPYVGDTKTVIIVEGGYLYKKDANGMAYLRPVIHLSSEVMYVSGTGSETNPYIFR